MAGNAGGDIKGGDIFRAFIDLVILVLLMVGAGFGGYWYGIHERLAPVKNVAPGTPGAIPATAITPTPAGTATPTSTATPAATPTTAATPTPATTDATPNKKVKFWVASSGSEWTGYQIIVNVNDSPVDGFVGPGKTVDVTSKLKHGENTISFQAKYLGENYNRHKNDGKAKLTVELVKGPKISDEYKSGDVLARFTRAATETDEETQSFTFTDGD